MAHSEKVLGKINAMEQRCDERRTLWQAVTESFVKEGADGITMELAKQMGAIQDRFDMALGKLDAML